MKLDEMTLLIRVADTGSMTLAARQMHLTPAAVSAAVRRVEEAIGVRLFDRTTRSVQPSDEGLVVLDACRDVVERWQSTLEDVRGGTHEVVGTVHISAPADTTYQVVGPTVVALADAHPELQVIVHSSDAVQHLHRDAIDMAIRYGPLQDSSLTARKLADQPGILVASPSYLRQRGVPQTPADLSHHRCITLQLSSVPVTAWTLSDGSTGHDVELRDPLCGDGYLARRWAIEGVGIAMKSLFDVIDDLEVGRLVRVLPRHIFRRTAIHAVFPSRRHLASRVRALDSALALAFTSRAERCEAWLRRTAEQSTP